MLTAYQEQWLAYDGAEVVLHGLTHRLKVRSYEAIYPYAHTILDVSAECLEKETPYYQEMKARLHDDFVTDVLHSNEELTVSVMQQLGWSIAD